MKGLRLTAPLWLTLTPTLAFAKDVGLFDDSSGKLNPVGWAGFLDTHFMIDAVSALLLAIVLGAVIGFHPTTPRTVAKLEEAEMPKVYVLYAFVGALIGVTVREFGMVIGVVVFGIGGLIRFRTVTDSTRDTGRLIVVTLIGLIAGLGLPHLAVIAAVFAFVLIFLFDMRPAYRVKIAHLPGVRLTEAAATYRRVLRDQKCHIISERCSHEKERVELVFRLPFGGSREAIDAALDNVPADIRGEIEWEID